MWIEAAAGPTVGSAPMPDIHHETAYFTGRVQGVGFRYAVLQVAREFEVSGFVSNLPDGRVVLEAEGTPEEVGRFIASVNERMEGYVRKVDRHTSLRTPQFSGFSIK